MLEAQAGQKHVSTEGKARRVREPHVAARIGLVLIEGASGAGNYEKKR